MRSKNCHILCSTIRLESINTQRLFWKTNLLNGPSITKFCFWRVCFMTLAPHKKNELTKISFEYYGGHYSKRVRPRTHPRICKICRCRGWSSYFQQNLGKTGYITRLGLILQIATALENLRRYTHLIHSETLSAINKRYSRDNWKFCFAKAKETENTIKPWGNTTTLGPEFKARVLGDVFEYWSNF